MSSKKQIASNPKAFSDFFIHEKIEAGIALQGTEVKSMRETAPQMKDSFVDIRKSSRGSLEAYLMNLHIAPYSHGNLANHEPTRKRKLLLHRKEIERVHGSLTRDGMTLIPTSIYFSNGKIKVEIGVAKGKKKGDKREDLKAKSAKKEVARAMRQKQKDHK